MTSICLIGVELECMLVVFLVKLVVNMSCLEL
jgi:hypothetical protein